MLTHHHDLGSGSGEVDSVEQCSSEPGVGKQVLANQDLVDHGLANEALASQGVVDSFHKPSSPCFSTSWLTGFWFLIPGSGLSNRFVVPHVLVPKLQVH